MKHCHTIEQDEDGLIALSAWRKEWAPDSAKKACVAQVESFLNLDVVQGTFPSCINHFIPYIKVTSLGSLLFSRSLSSVSHLVRVFFCSSHRLWTKFLVEVLPAHGNRACITPFSNISRCRTTREGTNTTLSLVKKTQEHLIHHQLRHKPDLHQHHHRNSRTIRFYQFSAIAHLRY